MTDRNRKELRNRALGLLLSLYAMALFIVWVIRTPAIIRYGITVTVAVLIIYLPLSNMYKTARLKKIRAEQLQKHQNHQNHQNQGKQ